MTWCQSTSLGIPLCFAPSKPYSSRCWPWNLLPKSTYKPWTGFLQGKDSIPVLTKEDENAEFCVWSSKLVKEQLFARKGRDGVGTREPGTGDVAKWQVICLAHARPWVQSPAWEPGWGDDKSARKCQPRNLRALSARWPYSTGLAWDQKRVCWRLDANVLCSHVQGQPPQEPWGSIFKHSLQFSEPRQRLCNWTYFSRYTQV